MAKRSKPDRKQLALRQQGALNPRPEQVTDQLFLTNEFFDPRDLVQVKYEMLRRVQSDGQPVSRAAAALGFSRPSFYQAQATFQQGGLPALVPHKRGPKQAHKLTPDPCGRSSGHVANTRSALLIAINPTNSQIVTSR